MDLITFQDMMFGTPNPNPLWWFVFEGIVTLWLIQTQEINNMATKYKLFGVFLHLLSFDIVTTC